MKRALAVLAATAIAVSSQTPAYAVTTPAAPNSVGVDVSHPQAGQAPPTRRSAAFAVVGVNGRTFADANPAFATQWAAADTLAGAAQLYVVAANPGPGGAFWHTGGPQPCAGGDTTGCAYDYGWMGAAQALSTARAAGLPPNRRVQWWIDVEEASTWNDARPALNAAVLRGIRDYLTRHGGALSVGIYTLDVEWAHLIGAAAGDLRRLPVWAVGAPGSSPAAARARCGKPSQTGGTVVMAQSPGRAGRTSADVICPIRATAAKRISAKGTARVTGTALPASVVRVAVVQRGRATRVVSARTDRYGHWSLTVRKLRTSVPAKFKISRSPLQLKVRAR